MLHLIEQIGSFAGLAAFLGLAVFALLSFSQGRDIRRLREWAGSAPERDAERKEVTSAVAAQRAEELRALEDARTAEQDALNEREVRRQRREQGLPEQTRGERLRGGFSGFGARLAEPRWLVAIFVVMVLVVGGAAYAILSGGGSSSAAGKHGGKHAKQAQVKPEEIEVSVLNGTSVPNLAGDYGDKVQQKGFHIGAVGNTNTPFEVSVVMFQNGHGTEAHMVSKQLGISKVQPMTDEVQTAAEGASVAVVVGEDNASAAG